MKTTSIMLYLKDEINLIKSGDYDDPDFDDEKVLMLSKNAYRRRVVVIRLSFGSLTFLYQLQYTNYNKFLRKFMVIY
jgi:hypothetical protein